MVFVGTCNLPFHSDVAAFSNAAFGQGTGPIYLTNVTCGATEIRLIDCPYSSDVSALTHADDAGASCSAVRKYLHENMKHIQSFVVCVCVCVCVCVFCALPVPISNAQICQTTTILALTICTTILFCFSLLFVFFCVFFGGFLH